MLEVRAIKPEEIHAALELHQQKWKPDHHLVIDDKTIQRHMKANPEFQIGAFFKGKLIGVVTTARFDQAQLPRNPSYEDIRMKTKPDGDTQACFILSTKMPREFREAIQRELDAHALLDGVEKKTIGALIIKKVAQMRVQQKIPHLWAASTPADLKPDPSGKPATLEEVQAHLDEGTDSVIFGHHHVLGARVKKIVPGGRPHSPNLSGRGGLVIMDYGPLPITPEDAAQNVQDRMQGLNFYDREKSQSVPAMTATTKTREGHVVSIELPMGVANTEFRRFIHAVQTHAENVEKESRSAGSPLHAEVSHAGLRLIHVTFKEKP
ncbi:hypothetical protein HY572_05150 [Candidatus Micrarchaeota archaeon]|nr:hypothetical protein [Candidatus Micrarchaeota archaeon]